MSIQIVKLPAVINQTGLGKSTIYLKMSLGEFPKPIRLGKRSVGWISEEIDAWVESRIAHSRGVHDNDS